MEHWDRQGRPSLLSAPPWAQAGPTAWPLLWLLQLQPLAPGFEGLGLKLRSGFSADVGGRLISPHLKAPHLEVYQQAGLLTDGFYSVSSLPRERRRPSETLAVPLASCAEKVS